MLEISSDHTKLMAREANEDEMVPNIVQEGKSVKEFDPSFFIVSLAHGQPKEASDYTILKNYDFLAQNRQMKPNRNDLKNYIRAHKSDHSSEKFANFQFLIYLLGQLDLDTLAAIAAKIANGEEMEDFMVEIVENLA